MATDNGSTRTALLSRRSSADISVLSPTRSAGNLIASAGAESASKARQLRHASTFNLRYIDPDMSDSSLGNLLRRHLLTQANGASDVQHAADTKSMKHVPPPPKKLSAKVERALQLRDQCERDLQKFCEAKRSVPRGLSPASSPCRAELLDKSYWFNPEHVHDNHGRDKSAFDRLMRKLSPAMKNAATTHADLVHMLQACSECALRATFCARCAKKASEFFENYTITELQALYCHELPPPDAKALDKFAEAMTERDWSDGHRWEKLEMGSERTESSDMEMPAPSLPTKETLLEMLDKQQHEMLRGYMALERQAKVMEERAKAAEARLTWLTRASDSVDGDVGDAAADPGQREQIQQLLRDNERLHAQLAAARVQLSDRGRCIAERDYRIVELQAQLDRATRTATATQVQQQRDEQQIKSLRASIRALEKELIESTSRYR